MAALAIGAVAAVAGFALLPRLIPWLYSSGYSAAVTPARILLPAAVATLAVAWAKALPAAVGRPKVRTIVSIVDLGVTALAIALLASRGAEGAATAVSIATVVSAVLWWVVARRMLAGMIGSEGRAR
jgi:O-antigen/teichoic acid export membrane protein